MAPSQSSFLGRARYVAARRHGREGPRAALQAFSKVCGHFHTSGSNTREYLCPNYSLGCTFWGKSQVITNSASLPIRVLHLLLLLSSQLCNPDQLGKEPNSHPFEKWRTGPNPKERSYSCNMASNLDSLEVEKENVNREGRQWVKKKNRNWTQGERWQGVFPEEWPFLGGPRVYVCCSFLYIHILTFISFLLHLFIYKELMNMKGSRKKDYNCLSGYFEVIFISHFYNIIMAYGFVGENYSFKS